MKVSRKIREVSRKSAVLSLGHWDTALKGNVPMSQSQIYGTKPLRASQSMGGPEGPPERNAGYPTGVTGRLRPGAYARPSHQKAGVFDAWLAGASSEQQARWERIQAGLAADPVKDDQLPPALRGGALEAF